MTPEFEQLLKEKKSIKKKQRLLTSKLIEIDEEIQRTCECLEFEKKSTYYGGGYGDRSESNTWDECIHCGKKFNHKVTYGSYS